MLIYLNIYIMSIVVLVKLKYYLVGVFQKIGWCKKSDEEIQFEYFHDIMREHRRTQAGTVDPMTNTVWPAHKEYRVEFPNGDVSYWDLQQAQGFERNNGAIIGDKGMNSFERVVDTITHDSNSQMIFLLSVVVIIIGSSVCYYFYKTKGGSKPENTSKETLSGKPENTSKETLSGKPEGGAEDGLDDSVKIPEEDMLVEDNTPWIDILDKIWDIFL